MPNHTAARVLVAVVWLALCRSPSAQPVFSGAEVFPREEFAARRAKIAERIGDAVAILLGTTERPGEQPFRQNNQFFYLTGVARAARDCRHRRPIEEDHALSASRTTSGASSACSGPALGPGAEAARATGIDAVAGARRVHERRRRAGARRAHDVHAVPSRSAGRSLLVRCRGAGARDRSRIPWDGRASREEAFIARLKAAAPRAEIATSIRSSTRCASIKSPREIAVIREATRITGLAIVEAMRDAAPGRCASTSCRPTPSSCSSSTAPTEPSYFALIATGPNTWYSHYHKNTAALQDGDLVQFDYAPDYKYYQSDVTRVFPANGVFTARQREFYSIYLELYRR